ncbi:SdrD B-like domain-containing protein [Schaalia sp. Marseille-Q2122]|uniref:DUF7927 domain-containing protein n=1 Tax=Schaalia sp. Marseille-Q2122 TaxID=2736604 RepID=UPI00158DC490|nr:SdrD B-like domain-containing protein [Schaalia sp. Marseille-Q2122]
MFGRLSTKIRPSAALVGALCVTLVIGTNTFAFANDGDVAPQSEAHITEVNSGNASVTPDEGAANVAESSESDAPANAPATPEPSTPEAVPTPAENVDTAPAPTNRSPFRKVDAAAANELSVHMEIKADGTPDDDRTGDGQPDFTVDDSAGNDSSAANGIVRVNDTVTYTLEYRSKVGPADNFTAKVVFPKGLYITQLPGVCRQPGSSLNPADPTANVTLPLTENSRDQLQEQTLLCNLGATETSALKVELVAKVSNLVHHGERLAIKSLTATADGIAEVPTDEALPEVRASAALKWDVSKNSMSTRDGIGYAYGPAIENCFWDRTRACFATRYNLLISSAVGGKGAMPVIGDVVIQDDLRPETIYKKTDPKIPGLTPDQINQVNANLEKYGSRATAGYTYYGMPGRKIGEYSNNVLNTVENSVRDSGALQIAQPGGPGTPVTLTVKNADFTLRTYPSKAVRPNNEAVPANRAYAVAHTFMVHTPADIVRDFGELDNGERALLLRNTYTDFTAQGFTPADRQTQDVYEGNNWLPKTLKIGLPGGFSKYFGGDVGKPGNSNPEEFSPGNGWVGEGLPGGGTYRSGDTGVAGTQDVVALIRGTAASPLYDFTGSTIVCDAWDNSKLHLKEKNWKGAVYDSREGIPTGFGRGVASNGKAVWFTGYNNVLLPSGRSTTDAIRADQVPELKVQYSATPGGNGAASTCGDDKGPWYDNPGDVPGNDQEKAARGVYTAVSRARAYFVSPPVVGLYSSIGNGYSVNIAFGFEVAPDLEPGTVIPNWASTKRVISTDKISYTMDQVLADNSAPWAESGFEPGTSLATGNSGTLGDRLIAADANVRINKQVRKGQSGDFGSTTPLVTGDDLVDYKITPSLTSGSIIAGIRKDVWIEDCLPGASAFVSASRTPDLVLPGSNPADIKRTACAPGDTYIRWILPKAEANAVIDPIIVTTEVLRTVPNGVYVNNVEIWGEGDASPLAKRRSSAGISVGNKTGLQLAKIALTPVLQVNPADSTHRDVHRWKVAVTNVGSGNTQAVNDATVIDVLPAQGINGTRYTGDFTFTEMVPKSADAASWVIQYTSTPAADLNPDPKHASNQPGGSTVWCDADAGGQPVAGAAGACPATKSEVTGIRVTRPGALPANSSIEFEVAMTGVGNVPAEDYINTVAASASNLAYAVGPLRRAETTIAASLGDRMWIDANGNGLYEDGEAPVGDALVRLEGTDDLGNPVRRETRTQADGTYSFTGLRASNDAGYAVTFTIPDTLKAEKYEFTSTNAGEHDRDSDPDTDGRVSSIVLRPGEDKTDIDAGIVKPAIDLVKEADRTEVAAGDTVTYTFTATNTGSAPLTNVTLDDHTFTNGKGQAITLDAAPVVDNANSTGTVARLAPGEKIVWTATYTVKAEDLELGTFITNVAKVKGTSPRNQEVEDEETNKIPPKGDGSYTIEKTSNPANGVAIEVGQKLTYTITVRHVGDLPVRNATLSDELSKVLGDAEYNDDLVVRTEGGEPGTAQKTGNAITWTGDLVKDQVVTLTYSVTSRFGINGFIENEVSPASHPKGRCLPDACTTRHDFAPGSYTFFKTAAVRNKPGATAVLTGDIVDYTITVAHAAGLDLLGAKVVDDLTKVLDDAAIVAAPTASEGHVTLGHDQMLTWTGDLAKGDTITITYSIQVNANGDESLVNGVTNGGNTAGSCKTGEACETTHTVTPGSFTVAKTADPATGSQVLSGQEVTYTLTVKHAGGDTVRGARIEDDLVEVLGDTKATYKADSLTASSGIATYNAAEKKITWTGDISHRAADPVRITYTVQVNAQGEQTLRNTVTVKEGNGQCESAEACTTTHTVPKGQYTYSKTADPASGTVVKSGNVITYTIVVKHSAGDRVKNASIKDDFSALLAHATYKKDAKVKSGNGTLNVTDAGVLTWEGDLAVGATEEITFSVEVDAQGGATLVNTLTSEDNDATRHSCDTAVGCQTTHTVQQGSFTYSKTADVANNAAVVSGDRITYTLTATHAGGDRVKDAFFTDDLSEILKHAHVVSDPTVEGPGVARLLKDPNDDQKVTGVEWRGTLNDTTAREAVVTFTVEVDTDATVTLTNTLGSTDTRGTCVAAGMCRTDHTVPEGSFVYSKVANVANAANVYSGDALNYTINVRHTGGNRIKQATVSDDLTELLAHLDVDRTKVTASAGAITWQGNVLTWTGDLDGKTAPSATIIIPTSVNAKEAATLTNRVTSDHARGTCDQAVGCETTHKVPAGKFTYSKVASAPNNETLHSGDVLTYTLNVSHHEGDRVLGATIKDDFTSLTGKAVYNEDAQATSGKVEVEDGVLTWKGDLERAATATITFSVTVKASGDATLDNSVTSEDARGMCDDEKGCSTTHVVPAGKFVYSKVAQVPSGSQVKKGDTITYPLKARHNEGDRILGAAIVDDLAKVLPYASYNGDAKADLGTVEYKEGKIYWTGDLARKAEATITFSVKVTADKAATLVNTVEATTENAQRGSCDKAVGCETTHTLVPPAKAETLTPKKKSAIPATGSIAQNLAGAAVLLMGAGMFAIAGVRRRRQG